MSNGASPSPLVVIPKKKKHDVKGQSQLNKCLNEKRRREQENIYIEELAELISASFADMSSLSVKPDKCAILQETVKHVLRAGTHRIISTDQTDNSLISTEGAVQQGEVSSSKPTRISNTELAPLLLSALDGFLFVVNPDGQIEFVTENIQRFLNYNKEELIGKSVYNIIHHGDHARFGVLLNKPLLIYNTSILSPGSNQPTSPLMDQSPSGSKGNSWNQKFTTKFNCRLLIKPPSDQNQTVEEKQTRVCQYETLQISSTKINAGMINDEETNQNLLCIARRVPYNEKHLSPPLEQFTVKLDKNGKILALDNKDVSDIYAQHINKDCLVGKLLHDLCHKNDIHKVVNHLKETRQAGFSTSPIYKLHLHEDSYVNVQTKSKYFKSNDNRELHFIMAAHSIIGDIDMLSMIENNRNATQTTDDQLTTDLNGSDSLPLMACGESNQLNVQTESKLGCSDYNLAASNDLNFTNFRIFPSTTYGDMLQDNKWSGHSPSSVEPSSKITPAPSPSMVSSNPQTPIAQTPQYNSFPFSPVLSSPKDSFESNSSNVERIESARLRTLLMTSKRTDVSSDENNLTNKHNILKGLLDPDEIMPQNVDELAIHDTSSPTNVRQQQQASHNSNLTDANNSNSNNNMLLKLLNDSSEDENYEVRTSFKKQNVLLQQLLNTDNIKQHDFMLEQNDQVSNEDLLMNSVGYRIISPTSSENIHGRKRNSISFDDENDRPPSKRTHSGPSILESLPSPSGSQSQVTNSKLRERNKMLASLLAKDLPPTNIPSIPASVISATPQDKLINIIKQPPQSAGSWNTNNGQHSMNVPSQNQRTTQPKTQHIGQNESQMRHVTSSVNTQLNNNIAEPNSSSALTFNSDPELSELLEEVMDIMNVNSENSTLLNLFNVIETTSVPNTIGQNVTNQNSFNLLMNEKMAVNAIQKSLMQVESSVKSPSQLNYGSPSGSGNNTLNVQNQFIPPPAYQPQKTVGFNSQQTPKLTGTPPYPKNVNTPPSQQQQLMHQQQKQRLIQQQKQRLLQQQQQQKIMLVTTNATIPDPTISLQTIDTILNNTGPPNVALQRALNVPDSPSQLSPVYTPNNNQLLNSSQISSLPNRVPIYSTLPQRSFAILNYGTTNTQTTSQAQIQQTTSRMSPSTQYQNPNSPCISQQQQTQNIYINQPQQPVVWTQQKLTNRIINNDQVTGGFNNNSVRQNFITQQQGHAVSTRVLTSPVNYNSEISPNTNCQQQQQQQQQQPFRLQRNINMTISNSQNLGGGNGVTEFTRNELRAFVGVRSQQGVNNTTRLSGQLLPVQNITPADLDSLGLNFELSPTGDNENPPKWSSLNTDLGSSSPQPQGMPPRNPIDDSIKTNSANSTSNVGETDQKSSLLQKLLSE